MAGRGIPQSRGFRNDPRQFVTQGESDALRANLLPDLTSWVVSPMGDAINGVSCGQVSLTPNRAYFFFIPTPIGTVQIDEARLRIVSNIASQSVSAALYHYDFLKRQLLMLPGTEANFSAASIARVTRTVSSNTQPNMKLFLGVWSSHLAIEVEGCCSGITGRVFDNGYIAWTSSDMPHSVPIASLIADTEADTPMVLYLSKEAATVL